MSVNMSVSRVTHSPQATRGAQGGGPVCYKGHEPFFVTVDRAGEQPEKPRQNNGLGPQLDTQLHRGMIVMQETSWDTERRRLVWRQITACLPGGGGG
ncbi:hypothetical protein EYF80_019917 [Liparis tanakae]|uniref:Uncharacterized protein n=1 Tax=Liparis tanakae TaxID=230148 RepID=A0A4Z2HVI1_9TELE|nr:hypothetical protein EYF80_019917 [Liparis tanakae]